MTETITCQEAIEAIDNAREVFVYVRTAISFDGTSHHTQEFPVSKELAIKSMKEICDREYVPNVIISEDGARVVIGQHSIAEHLPSLEHDDSNNGNF